MKNNDRFKKILEIALGVGNYLNSKSSKKGAWGFKIDSLERLERISDKSNKMNALFYVIKSAWKLYAYPIFDKEELSVFSVSSKLSITMIEQEIGLLRKSVVSLNKAIDSKIEFDEDDKIV